MRVGKMGIIPSSPTRMNMYVYTKNSPAYPLSSESKTIRHANAASLEVCGRIL